jgi:hypothetical protein
MTRLALSIAGVVFLAASASAQTNSIRWSMDVKGSIARAKSTRLPLMFYVIGRSSDRPHDIEREQKRAFADPLVVQLSQRFIPVKLSRSLYEDLLEKWQVPRQANMWIVFATPDGDKLGVLDSPGATKADSLAQKMNLSFRLYRQQMFDRELRPKMEDEQAPTADLKIALKTCYDVLAKLSTSACVNELLKRAADGDQQATAALSKCTPGAAEQMLAELGSDDPELHLIVYRAVTKICKVRQPKSDRFWSGKNERIKAEEIDRIKQLVRETARRWKEQYEEYR